MNWEIGIDIYILDTMYKKLTFWKTGFVQIQWPSADSSPSPAKLSRTSTGRRGLYETSSLTYPKYYFHDREEVIKANIRDPLQIVKIIHENEHIGFLYMISAVPRSSIEYDTYNLK